MLTPFGTALTISQIYRLDISQVFNILVKLGIPTQNIKSKRTKILNKKNHNFTLVNIISINN